MPDGSPFEADKPGPEATQTQWQGDRTASPDPVAAIHEDATILGGLDVQRPGSPSTDDRATGVADLAEFRRAVIDIGLIDETELETLASTIPGSEGVLGLARVLQQAGRLTRYQAAALYQRKSRGLLIGNYLILDKLGQGGMGVVFKARHRRLGRVVALKILPPSFARDKTAVDRFKREVEAAGRLKHPNVVAALDADEDRGVHFLVMEYVEGSDLDDVVRHRGQLPLGQAVDFVIQAARGLEAAHSQGIVHRDIKPSNLMLDGAGTVRVLDLGLARIVDASNPFGQAAGARLTQSGTYMGTVDYMAPEQAEDSRKADHRADIYSLGCTLYFLLTGREPFVGDTILKRLMAHMERPAPMLRGLAARRADRAGAGLPEDDGQAARRPARVDVRGDPPAGAVRGRGGRSTAATRGGAEILSQADGIRRGRAQEGRGSRQGRGRCVRLRARRRRRLADRPRAGPRRPGDGRPLGGHPAALAGPHDPPRGQATDRGAEAPRRPPDRRSRAAPDHLDRRRPGRVRGRCRRGSPRILPGPERFRDRRQGDDFRARGGGGRRPGEGRGSPAAEARMGLADDLRRQEPQGLDADEWPAPGPEARPAPTD